MKFLGAGVGILSLLITVGIMLYLFAGPLGPGGSSYGGTLAKAKRESTQQVNQFSGRDETGVPLSQTLTLGPWPATGVLKGAEVLTIVPGGVAQTHFGLAVGDVIKMVGPQDVGGMILSDLPIVGDFLDDAFARGFPLEVVRNGETVTLPQPGAAPATPPAGTTPPPPGTPAGTPTSPSVPRVPGLPGLPGGLNVPR